MSTDGILEPAGGRWRVRFVRTFPHPVERVWRAVTEAEHLAVWFPFDVVGERRVGAPLRFTSVYAGPEYDVDGAVLAFEPPHLFALQFGPDDVVRMELRPTADGGCELTFTDTFAERGKAARDAAGWHVCLDDLAASALGGAPRPEGFERWHPVNRAYREAFGPEASTIGPPEDHPVNDLA